MDDELNDFCSKLILHLDEHGNDYEQIISFTIRDIKENQLIYINNCNKWYQYHNNTNKWNLYDFNEVLNKIENLHDMFNIHMIEYLNNINKNNINKLNKNNINHFKRICYGVSGYIEHNELDSIKIRNYCQRLFSISPLVCTCSSTK
jgi:hypothetical protein